MNDAPVQYGRYQLLKKLAAGGMAQVWLARQSGMEGFEKLLVIKQVLPWLAGTDEFITMFLDEARLAARLGHPNVVQVFDLGKADDETLYIAMEYIHGEDLRRLDRESRKQRRPIPIELVVRIIADAAAGLHYAHSLTGPDGRPLGIVHRDVSPQNILVTFDGGVKVVDFGIAKAADKANKTRSGVLKGKYAYMSPEQASGKEVDHRTDIFALGIMLHELLTGQRLFKREGEILTLHAVVRCEVEPPSAINPIVPAALDAIVMSALARQPDDRYGTAQLFQRALEEFLVAYGQPASSAHLSDYMRELFAERLAIEAREGGPAAYLRRRSLTGSSARSVGLGGPIPDPGAKEGSASGSLEVSLGSMAGETTPSRSGSRASRLSQAGTGSARGPAADPGTTAGVPPAPLPGAEVSRRTDPVGSPATEVSRRTESISRSDLEDTDPGVGTASRVVQGMRRRRSLLVGGLAVGATAAAVLVGLHFFGPRPDQASGPAVVSAVGAPSSEDASPAAEPPGAPAPAPDPSPTKTPPEATPVAARTPEIPDTPPKTRTRPRTGRLRVSVDPGGAKVYVARGDRWRRYAGTPLPPGRQRLKIVLPDGSVHLEAADVAAGRTRPVDLAYRKGTLRVLITRPFGMGGRIKVGGRIVGRIPGDPVSLYEGTHSVVIEGDGGESVTRKVRIRPGATEKLTVQFD